MNDHWPLASLDQVCSLITDGTHHSPANGVTGAYKYVTAKNIRPWGLDLSDITYVDQQTHREIYARCPVEQGDVLYIKDGVTTGIAVVNPLAEPFSMLSSVALLKPNRQILDPRYLRHYLSSPETFARMTGAMTGSAIRRLVLRVIRAAEIPLAPRNEQERIANKLDSLLARVGACRERLDRVPRILKLFRQSVLAAAVSGELISELKKQLGEALEWREVALRDVAFDFSYGSAAKSAQSGTTPVLRMGNIQDGGLDWSDLVFTSDEKEIEKYKLTTGDVLFNRTNSPELVGKTAVFWGGREAIYAGYLIRVKCSSELLPDYLACSLNSPAGRDYCWRVKSDGVSQSNINAEKLRDFTFRLPPVEVQAWIVRIVKALFHHADLVLSRTQVSADALKKIADSVLSKAFRGELVPQDPNDESASVLLERFRAGARVSIEASAAIRPRTPRGRTAEKKEITMLSRKDVTPRYLTGILKTQGPLTAEALWTASKLGIDDFYDLLREEESDRLLREIRNNDPSIPRMLEAA